MQGRDVVDAEQEVAAAVVADTRGHDGPNVVHRENAINSVLLGPRVCVTNTGVHSLALAIATPVLSPPLALVLTAGSWVNVRHDPPSASPPRCTSASR